MGLFLFGKYPGSFFFLFFFQIYHGLFGFSFGFLLVGMMNCFSFFKYRQAGGWTTPTSKGRISWLV